MPWGVWLGSVCSPLSGGVRASGFGLPAAVGNPKNITIFSQAYPHRALWDVFAVFRNRRPACRLKRQSQSPFSSFQTKGERACALHAYRNDVCIHACRRNRHYRLHNHVSMTSICSNVLKLANYMVWALMECPSHAYGCRRILRQGLGHQMWNMHQNGNRHNIVTNLFGIKI